MENKSLYIVVLLIASVLAAPQRDDLAADIENSDVGYFYQNTRIVGGENAPDGSLPWQAAMSTGSVFRNMVCGSSLVSVRHFLTAAHCIESVTSCGIISGCSLVSSLRVQVGSNRWNSGSTTYGISRNLTHPHYVHNQIKNDIGLLITTSDVVITERVQMISLGFEYLGGGHEVLVSGWGRISTEGSLSNELKRSFMRTLDGQECVNRVNAFAVAGNIAAPSVEPHIELCAFRAVGEGTCTGDSGSPLVLVESGEQVGVVSWGFPCAIGAPDIFVRISSFKDILLEGLNTR